jgi:hypothetical protein
MKGAPKMAPKKAATVSLIQQEQKSAALVQALTSALENGHDVALKIGNLCGCTSDVEVLGESGEDEDTATETW